MKNIVARLCLVAAGVAGVLGAPVMLGGWWNLILIPAAAVVVLWLMGKDWWAGAALFFSAALLSAVAPLWLGGVFLVFSVASVVWGVLGE